MIDVDVRSSLVSYDLLRNLLVYIASFIEYMALLFHSGYCRCELCLESQYTVRKSRDTARFRLTI